MRIFLHNNLITIEQRVIVGLVSLLVVALVSIAVKTVHAAEPEMSPAASAIKELEDAKAELALPLSELEAESIRLQSELADTINSCRETRGEWIEASGYKLVAEGAVRALEEVSADEDIAARGFVISFNHLPRHQVTENPYKH